MSANRQQDGWLWGDMRAGAYEGVIFALMAKIVDATPCCGGFRTIIDLACVPFGLALFVFVAVELIRALIGLFQLNWRRAASLVAASLAIPVLIAALTVPLIFDVDYWRVRWDAQALEAGLRARAATDALIFAQIFARDVGGEFVTAPITIKRIIYDSSDEIERDGAARSADWAARTARSFNCEGNQRDAPRGTRIYGHFFVIYDGC